MFKNNLDNMYTVNLYISDNESYSITIDRIPNIGETICFVEIDENNIEIKKSYKIIDIIHFVNGLNNKNNFIQESTTLVLKINLEINDYNDGNLY